MIRTPQTESELVEFLDKIFEDLKTRDTDEDIEDDDDDDEEDKKEDVNGLLRSFEIEIPDPPVLHRTSAKDYGYEWFFTPTARSMSLMNDRMGKPQAIKKMNFPAFTETKRKTPSLSVIGPHSDLMSTPPGCIGIVKIREGICIFKNQSSERPIKKRRFSLLDDNDIDVCRRTLFRDD